MLCRPLQAINAAPYGVVGVLVYTDPLDINDGFMSDENETYPHSWYLPPSGVERGGYATNYGDLLTPYLAAKGEEALNLGSFGLDAVRHGTMCNNECFSHRGNLQDSRRGHRRDPTDPDSAHRI